MDEDDEWREDREIVVMQKKTKRRMLIIVIALLVLVAVGPFTITHEYGPYYGKVVEAETGEPIEGAYVLVAYYTEMYTFGGFVSKFVDTKDASTDKKGEFQIGAYRAWAFRFPQRWEKDCSIIVYKQRYKGNSIVYPGNEIFIKLHKAKTYKERLNAFHGFLLGGIPHEKQRHLHTLMDNEYRELGFSRDQEEIRK